MARKHGKGVKNNADLYERYVWSEAKLEKLMKLLTVSERIEKNGKHTRTN